MFINILKTPALSSFLIKFNFFQIFGKLISCSKFMDPHEPVKLFKAGNRDTG